MRQLSTAAPPDVSQAAVIGASIAGLLTARALADRFDRVVVLERDRAPDGSVPRAGVPQEHHVRLLLQRGKRMIEWLLPGIMAELEAEGALVADLCGDVKCYQAGRWRSGITAPLYSTRTLLKHVLRRRVRALPNVHLYDRTEVAAPTFGGAGLTVTDVRAALVDGTDLDIPAATPVGPLKRYRQTRAGTARALRVLPKWV